MSLSAIPRQTIPRRLSSPQREVSATMSAVTPLTAVAAGKSGGDGTSHQVGCLYKIEASHEAITFYRNRL